jgi:hypothetical protein
MGEFDQVDFPCVKTLHLNYVYFISHEYIAKFLFGCPILEDLQLHISIKHKGMAIKNLGALPNLVKVRITDNWRSTTPMALVCNAKILQVKDVCIQWLWFRCNIVSNYSLHFISLLIVFESFGRKLEIYIN